MHHGLPEIFGIRLTPDGGFGNVVGSAIVLDDMRMVD